MDWYFSQPDHDPDVIVCGDLNTPSQLSGQTGEGGITLDEVFDRDLRFQTGERWFAVIPHQRWGCNADASTVHIHHEGHEKREHQHAVSNIRSASVTTGMKLGDGCLIRLGFCPGVGRSCVVIGGHALAGKHITEGESHLRNGGTGIRADARFSLSGHAARLYARAYTLFAIPMANRK